MADPLLRQVPFPPPPGWDDSLEPPPLPRHDEPEFDIGGPADGMLASAADAIEIATLAGLTLPRASTADTIVRLGYRIGIPPHFLARPLGRKVKPRLLATVENPLPGDRVAGTALRTGQVLVHGALLPLGAIDYREPGRLPPPLARSLHGFHWLADLEAGAPRESVSGIAERLFIQWLDAHPKPPRRAARATAPDTAWTLANTGWRLLNWLVHTPLILSGTDRAARARAYAAMEQTARWLEKQVRRAPDPLSAAVAWSALVAAGLLLAGGKPRRLWAEHKLLKPLGEMVGEDGGVHSRSPLAQAEAIALLVKLRACYRACRRQPPAAIETMLAMLLPPLLSLVHGDGGLGSWHGGWAIDAETIDALHAATGLRRRAAREAQLWGYHRIASARSVLVIDTAPPPLAQHARFACASSLAFEFSHGIHRIVVNCGGAEAAGGLLPANLERGLRASAAHSTLTLGETNSTAILPGGKIGKGVGAVSAECARIADDNGATATRLDTSHDGYVRRYGLVHHRTMVLATDGRTLEAEDRIEPAKKKGRRKKLDLAIRFHLGPDVRCYPIPSGRGAQLVLPDGSAWEFRASEGAVSVDDSVWVDGAGRPVAIRQLVLSDTIGRKGGSYAWSFALAG
jgi:uncharacterized heparinase superfamily protein